ncbi:MAG: sigma-54-dependent Fis family transcriptional regulator [Myxococcales bacterium]|nr:sigma-54-dependent Fis family transcriptional regulator [Myxococcales bacterium]
MSVRILVVDDKPNMRRLLASVLEPLGEVVCVDGGARALERLGRQRFHVVVTDIKMPDVDGHQVLRFARRLERPPEVILITGFATVESAIEALRDGAVDYVTKPFDPDELKAKVARVVGNLRPTTVDPAASIWHGMVGRTSVMLQLFHLIERAGPSDAPVLILGESGTGKELIARALHALSARALRPFVAVNCAAIPSSLMEAELFGHARGAFTGASSARAGLFEEANGGTLFLDELGELRRSAQAKLTRVLEARAIRRVGETHERPADVRVIAATHRDIPALVAQEAFREDLFYRLNTCIVRVPPLRERPDDIPLLAEWFLGHGEPRLHLTAEASAALGRHSWPGNVRELRSALAHAAIVAEGSTIAREDLPAEISLGAPIATPDAPRDLGSLTYREALERVRADGITRYLEVLLEQAGGNVVAASERADVERESLYRLCRKHGVNPTDYRAPKSRG